MPNLTPRQGRGIAEATYSVIVGGALSKGALVAAEFALARFLGAEEFGRFAIVTSFVVVMSSVALLGFDHGVIQALTRPDESSVRRRATVLAATVGVGAAASAAAIATFFLASSIAKNFLGSQDATTIVQLAALALVFESLNNLFAAVLRAQSRFGLSVLVFDGARNLILAIGAALLVFAGVSLTAVMLAYTVGAGCGMLVAVFALLGTSSGSPLVFNRSAASDLLRFSRSLSLWSILQVSSAQVYVVLAGAFLMPAEVGALAIGLRVVFLLNFLRTALTASVQREFATMNHTGDSLGLERLLQRSSLSLFVCSGVIVLPFLLGPSTVMGVFGSEWVSFSWILWPLLLAKLINVMGGPVGQLLIATGHGSTMLRLSALEITLQSACLVPLMMFFGLAGAIVGEVIRVVVITSVRHICVLRRLQMRSFTVAHAWVMLSLIGGLSVGSSLRLIVMGPTGFLAAIVVACLTYEVLLRILGLGATTPLRLVRRFGQLGFGKLSRFT